MSSQTGAAVSTGRPPVTGGAARSAGIATAAEQQTITPSPSPANPNTIIFTPGAPTGRSSAIAAENNINAQATASAPVNNTPSKSQGIAQAGENEIAATPAYLVNTPNGPVGFSTDANAISFIAQYNKNQARAAPAQANLISSQNSNYINAAIASEEGGQLGRGYFLTEGNTNTAPALTAPKPPSDIDKVLGFISPITNPIVSGLKDLGSEFESTVGSDIVNNSYSKQIVKALTPLSKPLVQGYNYLGAKALESSTGYSNAAEKNFQSSSIPVRLLGGLEEQGAGFTNVFAETFGKSNSAVTLGTSSKDIGFDIGAGLGIVAEGYVVGETLIGSSQVLGLGRLGGIAFRAGGFGAVSAATSAASGKSPSQDLEAFLLGAGLSAGIEVGVGVATPLIKYAFPRGAVAEEVGTTIGTSGEVKVFETEGLDYLGGKSFRGIADVSTPMTGEELNAEYGGETASSSHATLFGKAFNLKAGGETLLKGQGIEELVATQARILGVSPEDVKILQNAEGETLLELPNGDISPLKTKGGFLSGFRQRTQIFPFYTAPGEKDAVNVYLSYLGIGENTSGDVAKEVISGRPTALIVNEDIVPFEKLPEETQGQTIERFLSTPGTKPGIENVLGISTESQFETPTAYTRFDKQLAGEKFVSAGKAGSVQVRISPDSLTFEKVPILGKLENILKTKYTNIDLYTGSFVPATSEEVTSGEDVVDLSEYNSQRQASVGKILLEDNSIGDIGKGLHSGLHLFQELAPAIESNLSNQSSNKTNSSSSLMVSASDLLEGSSFSSRSSSAKSKSLSSVSSNSLASSVSESSVSNASFVSDLLEASQPSSRISQRSSRISKSKSNPIQASPFSPSGNPSTNPNPNIVPKSITPNSSSLFDISVIPNPSSPSLNLESEAFSPISEFLLSKKSKSLSATLPSNKQREKSEKSKSVKLTTAFRTIEQNGKVGVEEVLVPFEINDFFPVTPKGKGKGSINQGEFFRAGIKSSAGIGSFLNKGIEINFFPTRRKREA